MFKAFLREVYVERPLMDVFVNVYFSDFDYKMEIIINWAGEGSIKYVRYGGHFLVGLSGRSSFCGKHMFQIDQIVLEVWGASVGVDSVTVYTNKSWVIFIGLIVKSGPERVEFRAPVVNIEAKLEKLGYRHTDGKEHGKACAGTCRNRHAYLVDTANLMFNNINRYYRFVENRPELIEIVSHKLW